MRKLLAVLFAAAFGYSPLLWAAFQTVYGVWVPFPDANFNAGSGPVNINTATEKLAFIGVISKTCTLNKAGFLVDFVGTGDTLRASFQDVSLTTGDPDGVVDHYGTVVIADTDDNKWIDNSTSPALGLITSGGNGAGSGRAVTIGDRIALVVDFNSWVAGDLYIRAGYEKGFNDWLPSTNVYADLFLVSWAKVTTTWPIFALGCDDGTWQFMESVTVYKAVLQNLQYNNGSVADEVALRFQFPMPVRLGQVKAWLELAGDADLILYDGASNPTFTLDANVATVNTRNWAYGQFPNVELEANTVYRLAVKPTTATNIRVYFNEVNQASLFDVMGGGREFYWSQRVDGGAWTDTTTKRPFISLGLNGFDSGGGGGTADTYVARSRNLGPQLFGLSSR